MKQAVYLSFAFELFEVEKPVNYNSDKTSTGFVKPTQMKALRNWLRKAKCYRQA